ncbi:unnamed protein product [Closterium sp. NIES-54]
MSDDGVASETMDTLEAQEAAMRERFSDTGNSAEESELIILGLHEWWARDHPPPRAEADNGSAALRAEDNDVNLGNGGERAICRLIWGPVQANVTSVGGTQAQVLRAAAAGSARDGANGSQISARRIIDGRARMSQPSTSRDMGIAPEYGYFKFSPDKITVPKLLEGRHDLTTWEESIEPQLEIAQLKKFVDGSVVPPPDDDYECISQFHSAQLLTFMVILRCYSPIVQVALKPCCMREDAGFQAWQFIMKTYKATDDLYRGQLEQRLTNLKMGEHESATSYCIHAQQILADLRMQLVKNEMVAGIRVKGEPDEVLGCPTCMQAKFTRYPFSSSEATAKAPLDEVVMDVVGPLKLGAAGAEYFLTIVDVYTRMTWVYVLSKKSDVAETVKTDWLPMVERQQDRLVKAIRTDRGGEFLSKEFGLWLKKNGIRHSLTMPYSPAMNGIAERANRTITETARGLLIEAGLPDYFWPDAVRSVCVAKNRALTHVGANKWVPYVEWIGRKPKVDMLRVFGCMCMALVPKHLRHNKLGAKAIWAVHLGMAQNSKGSLLAGAAIKGWVVKQMDVTTAFLNDVLEEEIFMAQPEGFDDGSGRVLRLKKAFNGLKQAPRQWYLKLRGVLEEIGFTPSTADHSLFMLGEGEQRSFSGRSRSLETVMVVVWGDRRGTFREGVPAATPYGNTGSQNEDNRGKSSKKEDHRRGQRRRYCFVCGDPEHLSYQCPDRAGGDSGDEHEGPRERANAGQSRREIKHNDSSNHQPANNARRQQRANSAGGGNTNASANATTTTNTNGTGQASPSKETSISLAPVAGEDFQAVAVAVHANPSVVLLDSGCLHHLMGDRNAFVGMQDGGDVSHVHGFNRAIQPVRRRGRQADPRFRRALHP